MIQYIHCPKCGGILIRPEFEDVMCANRFEYISLSNAPRCKECLTTYEVMITNDMVIKLKEI